VLNRPEVQDWYRERFLIFAVDIEGETEVTDFQGTTMTAKDFAFRVNRIRATPVFVFYDLEGAPMVRYTGVTRDADEFLWLGEFVADNHYQNTKFTRFKRAKLAERKAPQQTQ
jgi:thioredoxin-related protein